MYNDNLLPELINFAAYLITKACFDLPFTTNDVAWMSLLQLLEDSLLKYRTMAD
jgi:hypothetical protein